MKRVISRTAIFLAVIFLSLNANAQTSENPRRVWVVAHACNCYKWLRTAVEDGASGVEIDINCPKKINPTATSVDISVNHDHGYYSPEDRKRENSFIDHSDYYMVSLKDYLNFDEMDKINILWLDLKPTVAGQAYHIVKEVHRILEERYGSKEAVPFSIIYGVYKMYTLRDNIGDYSLAYPSTPLIDWLRDNLWENEGINLACEGPHGPYGTSETLEDLKKFFNGHNFPEGKHFASQGTGLPFCFFNWKMVNTLVKLKEMRDQGGYCVRTGAWTMGREEYAMHFIPNKADYPESYGTECDLLLVEAQNSFAPPSFFSSYDHYAVQKLVRRFFRPRDMAVFYSKYNRGHYVLAGNRWEDPFYK